MPKLEHCNLFPAVMAAKSGASELAHSSGLLSSKDSAGAGWNNVAPCISGLPKEAYRRFSSFKQIHSSDKEVDLFGWKSILPVPNRSVWESLGTFHHGFFHARKSKQTKLLVLVVI